MVEWFLRVEGCFMSEARFLVTCFKAVGLTIAATLLSACATLSRAPDEQVGERVRARYAALIAADYQEAHKFYTPAFRKSWTYRELILMRPPVVKYVKASLASVKCSSEDACDVGVEVTYRTAGGIRGVPEGFESSRYNEEKWIRVDGEWWFYQPD
ncbi:MAG: hypothetical protein PHI64_02770 [Zoogloea sp.]|uniref:hypothetical protein n=1 Tax=Zoogloea sp. TaxID=49181 RepID=UPI0026078B66|nr:hypothetical protein [Zoogloea sp.]MDD2987860.1 hypothetical protein [Zoogloea sp.]